GREPTSAELAREAGLPVREIEDLRGLGQTPLSLEKRIGEEETQLGEFIADDSEPQPQEAAEASLRAEEPARLLSGLTDRARRTLELRFGLGGGEPQTLDEVGRQFNVTRERIRQIESRSLAKLRTLALAAHVRHVA